MDYERGLEQLKQLVYSTNQPNDFLVNDFLVYEQRLRENLRDEQRYGTNEQIRSIRSQIIDQLNRLARQAGNTSFNDLCMAGNILNLQMPPKQPANTASINTTTNAQPQTSSIKSNSQRIKAYICYSSRDKAYLDELHSQLDFLANKGIISYWDRSKMMPGANKQDEITSALDSTKVAIMLISADFLAAEPPDPIAVYELPTLLKAAENKEVTILNVILGFCSFEYSDLEPFEAVNPDQFMSDLSQNKRAKIWQKVVKQVRDILS